MEGEWSWVWGVFLFERGFSWGFFLDLLSRSFVKSLKKSFILIFENGQRKCDLDLDKKLGPILKIVILEKIWPTSQKWLILVSKSTTEIKKKNLVLRKYWVDRKNHHEIKNEGPDHKKAWSRLKTTDILKSRTDLD